MKFSCRKNFLFHRIIFKKWIHWWIQDELNSSSWWIGSGSLLSPYHDKLLKFHKHLLTHQNMPWLHISKKLHKCVHVYQCIFSCQMLPGYAGIPTLCIWYALACGNTCMFFHVVICGKWITHVREVCALHRIVSCLQTAGTTRHLFTAVWSDIHLNLNQLITADIESCFQPILVCMYLQQSLCFGQGCWNTQTHQAHD